MLKAEEPKCPPRACVLAFEMNTSKVDALKRRRDASTSAGEREKLKNAIRRLNHKDKIRRENSTGRDPENVVDNMEDSLSDLSYVDHAIDFYLADNRFWTQEVLKPRPTKKLKMDDDDRPYDF